MRDGASELFHFAQSFRVKVKAHFKPLQRKVSKVNYLQIVNKERKMVTIGHVTANNDVISQSKEHKKVSLVPYC